MQQRRWLELIKDYDLTIQYNLGKANVIADTLSRKMEGSLAAIITHQLRFMRELEKMQLEVRIREPGEVTSWVNQVSVQYDLYRSNQGGTIKR